MKHVSGIIDDVTALHTRRDLHLDNVYRRRWREYHLFDGTVKDSREINWRQVEWEKVVKVVVHIRDEVHTVDCVGKPSFQTFVNFSHGGFEHFTNERGELEKRAIRQWCIGWTDGTNVFIKEIDFATGLLVREYVEPLAVMRGQIHPRVTHLANRK